MKEPSEIESLVAETFGHLAPSPEIEEELLESLPAERAGPRRPWRWLTTLPIAAAVLIAIFWPRPGPEPHSSLTGATAETAVIVRLERGGLLLVQPDDSKEDWEEVSLKGLASYLEAAAKAYDEKMVAAGKNGYEDLPGGLKGSLLWVVLRADRDTPWQHAQWWMTVCAQERFRHLRIAHEGTLLDATLPVDRGLNGSADARQPTEFKVAVQIDARSEKLATFGGSRIMMATRFIYRWALTESDQLEDVSQWMRAAARAAQGTDIDLVGEIKADPKVAVRIVAGLLAKYRELGFERVRFHGTAIPSEQIRNAPRLPYPIESNPAEHRLGLVPRPEMEAEIVEEEEIEEEEIEEEILEEAEPPAKRR